MNPPPANSTPKRPSIQDQLDLAADANVPEPKRIRQDQVQPGTWQSFILTAYRQASAAFNKTRADLMRAKAKAKTNPLWTPDDWAEERLAFSNARRCYRRARMSLLNSGVEIE